MQPLGLRLVHLAPSLAFYHDRRPALEPAIGEEAPADSPDLHIVDITLRDVGIADLVVADLETNRAPGLPKVIQLHVERPHDVFLGNALGMRGGLS